MQHVRALDGIRGIAVLLVMLFHFGYFPGGWIGVQIFFALSGFLITDILLKDREAPFAAFAGRFYWRRTLRIFPLFYCFLLIVAVSYALTGTPASFPSDWVWLITYTANFARVREADVGPYFIHIWSLAVEEQFYLIWPFLLYFLPLRGFRWTVAGFLILAPLVRYALFREIVASGYSEQYGAKAVYVLPLVQFDAFAAGAMIPLWNLRQLRNAGTWFLAVLAVVVAAGVGVLALAHIRGGAFVGSLGYAHYLIQGHGYVWGYTLLNILTMLAIVCTLQRHGPTRLLENGWLVWTGKVSYGIYVYHLPVLLAGAILLNRWGVSLQGIARHLFFLVWVASVILVSGASFRWLETPFLKLKDKWHVRERGAARRHAT